LGYKGVKGLRALFIAKAIGPFFIKGPWREHLQTLSPRPLRAEPFRAEPFRAEPFRAEPFRAEPFRAEPFRAEPFRGKYGYTKIYHPLPQGGCFRGGPIFVTIFAPRIQGSALGGLGECLKESV
jgi:hypothetical protein